MENIMSNTFFARYKRLEFVFPITDVRRGKLAIKLHVIIDSLYFEEMSRLL